MTRNRKPAQSEPTSGSAPQTPSEDLLTMEDAIALLKTTRPTFYRWLRGQKIKGLKLGRQWRFHREDIERFVRGQQPRVDTPISPAPLIAELEAQLAKISQPVRKAQDTTEDPISRAVYRMIRLAYHQRATDMHLHPDADGSSILLRLRIDGVLYTAAKIDARLRAALMERWKTMAGLKTLEMSLPQDGRIMIKLDGKDLDIRICTMPSYYGESLTARLLRRETPVFDLGALGYSPADEKRLRDAVRSPQGLVIVTGPTGTGKTTTLYSCLNMLNSPEVKLMTVEDPVECTFSGMVQVQLNEAAGLSFSRCIRSLLRSGPNIIMVGEIRDADVMWLCMMASMTGLMVLTTLHASDSALALRRMLDLGALPSIVGDATKLILSQRLVRKLCPHCAKPAKLTAEEEALMSRAAVRGGLVMQDLPRQFRQPVGCTQCGQTGYWGLLVIAETLQMSPAIAKALRENASADEMRRIAVSEGMTTMAADGIRKSAAGLTTLKEIERFLDVRAGS